MNLNPSDEELMLAYQLGDEHAFTRLYERHSGRVYGFIKSKVQNEAQTKDIFQATFLKLHKSRSRYDSAFPFVPWLFTICRSELLDAVKKPHHRQENLDSEIPESPNTVDAQDNTPILDLSRLSAPQREALELRYKQDFSFEEIAVRLNTSPGNARKLVSRAIQFLRGTYGKR